MEAKRENPQYHAILYKDGQPIEVHHMTLEPTETQSRYRALVSMNWFNDREVFALTSGKSKLYRTKIKCHSEHEIDLRFERCAYAPDVALIDTLPSFTHTSIWEFYAAIGYDRKRKRYVRE